MQMYIVWSLNMIHPSHYLPPEVKLKLLQIVVATSKCRSGSTMKLFPESVTPAVYWLPAGEQSHLALPGSISPIPSQKDLRSEVLQSQFHYHCLTGSCSHQLTPPTLPASSISSTTQREGFLSFGPSLLSYVMGKPGGSSCSGCCNFSKALACSEYRVCTEGGSNCYCNTIGTVTSDDQKGKLHVAQAKLMKCLFFCTKSSPKV